MTRPAFIRLDEITNADPVASLDVADVLQSFGRDVVLFTPALLITHGGFDRDPVTEFAWRCPVDDSYLWPFCIDLKATNDSVFFSGLGVTPLPGSSARVNWDKRLYGIAKEREEECFSFLKGIGFSNPKTGFLAGTFAYDVAVTDPTRSVLQPLPVKVFGVVSNNAVAWLESRPNKPPAAKVLAMPSADNARGFLQQRGLTTDFTGINPVTSERES